VYAVGENVDKKSLLVDAFEARTLGDLLQKNHPHAPPIGSWRDAAGYRFRSHIAGGFERRHDVQVELGKPCGSEATDDEVKRLPRTHKDGRRPQIPVPQSGFGEGMNGLGKLGASLPMAA
jgi:hypothetical protein